MLRLVELALFVAPFAIFVAWRVMPMEDGPSTRFVTVAACVLVVLVAALVWLSQEAALPPEAGYAPARLEDGKVISGHAASP